MTTFGLVHGAWHGGWCWKYVVAELEARGHATVAPDLPCDDAAAGLADYAHAVIGALGEADDVVLVGHSMGSLVIPLVAAARPVTGMVFLCSVPLVPGVTVGPDLAGMVTPELAGAPRFCDELGRDLFDNATARRVFYHDCDDDLAAWAVSRLRPQGPRPLTEPSPLGAWPEVPSEVVLTDDDRAVSAAWAVEAARGWLGRDPIVLPGSHSPFVSHPAALADALVNARGSFV
jgi:pimeloyl-ACP methyl ester carboxylesterase